MKYQTLAIAIALGIAVSGCSSKPKKQEITYVAPTTVEVPVRHWEEFRASWGHEGRGGAALRKPTYQHVIASEDAIVIRPVVRNEESDHGAVKIFALRGTPEEWQRLALAQGVPAPSSPQVAQQKPSTVDMDSEQYLRAYRKFCKGATNEMTEEEWSMVALGGPNHIPPSLRGKCLTQK
ncbi:hypothetical protein [Pseudomonas frederiksbergensis]|uniref:hypothetical protein n=1 Tax=Pseudomonas frederiksbergensis TaxID=104087 RepID=UPI00101AE422|nr:hypothetical protein [Pseudomonas frederiksbergensis]